MVHKNCFDVGMLVYNPFYMNVGFNDALHNIVENTGLVTRTMVVMTMQDKMQEEQSIIKRAMQDEAFAQLIEFDGVDYVAQWYENLKHYAVRYTTYKAEDWITNPEWTKTSEYYIDPVKVSPNKVDADNVSINKAICSKAIQTLGKYAKKGKRKTI